MPFIRCIWVNLSTSGSEHFCYVTGIPQSVATFEKGTWFSYWLNLDTVTKSQKNNGVFNKENLALEKWSVLQLCHKVPPLLWANCFMFPCLVCRGFLMISILWTLWILVTSFTFVNTEVKAHGGWFLSTLSKSFRFVLFRVWYCIKKLSWWLVSYMICIYRRIRAISLYAERPNDNCYGVFINAGICACTVCCVLMRCWTVISQVLKETYISMLHTGMEII